MARILPRARRLRVAWRAAFGQDGEVRTIQLTSAKVALFEYGDPAGEPLLFLHGWPGSGRQGGLVDAVAKKHGFRVVAPDRPGIGGSERIPARRIGGWPALMEEMMDHLEVERFAVLGVSGGGPYALACAGALPERIRVTSVVCGAPPIAELTHHRDLSPVYQFLLWIYRRKPRVVRNIFALARPLLRWRGAREFLPPLRHLLLPEADAQTLSDRDTFAIIMDSNRDAFQDVDGLFEDAALYAVPWEIPLESIQAPVQFWHGTEDSNFHWSLAQELAARLPRATFQVIEDEAHFSLPIRRADTIVGAMREACGNGAPGDRSPVPR